jgi:hypothetical protein
LNFKVENIMALFVEFKPILGEIAKYLRILATRDCCNIPVAGTSSVPAGLKTVSITKTSPNTDTVTITFPDGVTYDMTQPGEVFTHSADGGRLPAYTVSGTGTVKWHGIK